MKAGTEIKKFWMVIPALLGGLLYLLSIGHGFVLDDNLVLTQNSHVQQGVTAIPELLTTNYTHGHQQFNDGLYRPLSLVTFAVESSLFDLNPRVSHLLQALLYALLLWVLTLWLQRLFGQYDQRVFWALLLFALHPLHTEVVANLKSRDELLALLFFAWSAYSLLRWMETRRLPWIVWSLITFQLALFSKESAVTFVAVVPWMLWYKSEKPSFRALWPSLLFVAPTGVFLAARSWVLSSLGPVDEGISSALQNVLTTSDSLLERLLTASWVQGMYLWKLFVPFELSHDYSFQAIPIQGASSPLAWIAAIILLALLAYVLMKARRPTPIAFGIGFYFLTMAVVANIFLLIGALAAERFVFTPSLGWSIAVSFAAFQILGKRSWLRFVLIGYAVYFTAVSAHRIPDWKDNFTLFTTDVHKVPNSARAHYNAGTASNDQAKKEPRRSKQLRNKAAQHLRKAIEIWPDYQDAYNNLGVVYIDQGETLMAYELYQRTYKRFPTYNKGLFNLAVSAYQLGKYAEAEQYFETYYDRITSADALYMAAESEGYQNKFDEAIVHLEQLINLEPTRPRAYLKLGTAYGILGDQTKAERYFKEALRVAPNNAEAHFNLALVYLNTDRREAGAASLRDALSLDPSMEQARQLLERL